MDINDLDYKSGMIQHLREAMIAASNNYVQAACYGTEDDKAEAWKLYDFIREFFDSVLRTFV